MENPSQYPENIQFVSHFEEPVVRGTLVLPNEYLGALLTLCENKRGIQQVVVYSVHKN